MVDLHTGDRLHGGDLERLARLVGQQVALIGTVRRAVGLAEGLVVGEVVRLVDLPLRDPEVGGVRVRDQVVARYGEADGFFPPAKMWIRISVSVSCAPTSPSDTAVALPACRAVSRLLGRVCPSKVVRLSRPITRMFIAPTLVLPGIVIPFSVSLTKPTTLWA